MIGLDMLKKRGLFYKGYSYKIWTLNKIIGIRVYRHNREVHVLGGLTYDGFYSMPSKLRKMMADLKNQYEFIYYVSDKYSYIEDRRTRTKMNKKTRQELRFKNKFNKILGII
jgi:hypothetical protein